MTIAITSGGAVLLEALRHGWNIVISMPDDVRKFADEDVITTTLRAGKATDQSYVPAGTWKGRDGLYLVNAGLARRHGKGGVYLPADLINQHPDIRVVGEDAVAPLLKKGQVTELFAYHDGDSVEIAFCWHAPDRQASVGMSLSTGQLRTLRRLVDGEPIDQLVLDGTDIRRDRDGAVTITRYDAYEGIDIRLHGDALILFQAVLSDMSEGNYEASIGLTVPGALYL